MPSLITYALLVLSSLMLGCGEPSATKCSDQPAQGPTEVSAQKVCPPCAEAAGTEQSRVGTTGSTLSGPVDATVAGIALKVWSDLANERFAEVNKRFETRLAKDLTPKRLAEIMSGVRKAHGAAAVIDAWETTVREEGEQLPAASVLLRMSKSKTRFRLLLVFNPDSTVRGFWFKPI